MTRLVAELIEKSRNMDLKKLAKQERCLRMKTRLQALYLLTTGMNQKKVAETTLTTSLSVRRWTGMFIAEGVGGLRDKPGCGRKRKLPKTEEAAFVADLKRLREESKGGRIIAKDVQRFLLEKYQVTHSLKAVYVLLGRFGFSWISCRSKHPKRSQEAIDDFKSGFSDVVSEIKKK